MSTVEQLTTEQRFVLRDADWQTYQSMLATVGDRPIRVTYNRGSLEIMSPSGLHERLKKLLDRLLIVLSEELDIPFRSQGSTTFNKESLDRGLEPDECYYIQNESKIRGRDEVDLSVDPPPDLAVEIDITSSSIDRLEIYAALGVPEVWRYDGKVLQVYELGSDGCYIVVNHSIAFPSIPLEKITDHLNRRNETDELTWTRMFREWIRNTISEK
ncbi:MAG: Uma2 family endonuclease [Planctomycetes bacterium]|nr:Uma2 family endonuclease [Planctomycetota bacterium]